MLVRKLIIIVVSVALQVSFAAAQLGEPISGFNDDEVWLCKKPTPGRREATVRLERVPVSTLGAIEDILISAYFPANGLVGLLLGDDRNVYVEYGYVEPINRDAVAEKMNTKVPPGTCISGLLASTSDNRNTKSGVRRGFGGC
jgi:hypothetical protein